MSDLCPFHSQKKDPGFFIVLEGLDACGKTTQIPLLERRFLQKGQTCRLEKEPTEGPVGKLIRQVNAKNQRVCPEALALLFAADRFEHAAELAARRQAGEMIICDRYVLSSLAYQSLDLPMETVWQYNQLAMERMRPDLTILIDTPLEECVRRIASRGKERELFEEGSQLRRIQERFVQAAGMFQTRWPDSPIVHIDGTQTVGEISEAVWKAVCAKIG